MYELKNQDLLHLCKSNAVQALTDLGPPSDLFVVADRYGATCIHYASRSGSLQILDFLKSHPVNWEARTGIGSTALHDACVLGNIEVVDWLLSNTNCSMGDEDNTGMTPLHLATRFGHLVLLEWYFHRQGPTQVDMTHKTSLGATMLHLAAAAGHLDTVKFLVENRPNKVRDEELLQSEVMWVLAVDHRDEEHAASGHSDRSCPCCNLNMMANAQMQSGATAVYMAAQNGHLEVLQYLILEAGASPKIIPYDGMNCLHAAVQNGHVEVVKWLLHSQCHSVNGKDFEGMTPLHFAATAGHHEILAWLLDNGAKINTDFVGGTPLHSAAQSGEIECCRMLLESGVSPDALDEEGFTAVTLADKCFNYGCAGFITKWIKERKENELREKEMIERRRYLADAQMKQASNAVITSAPDFIDIPPPPSFSPPPVPNISRDDKLDKCAASELLIDTHGTAIFIQEASSASSSNYSTPRFHRKQCSPVDSSSNELQPRGVQSENSTMRSKWGTILTATRNEPTTLGDNVIKQLETNSLELRRSLRQAKTNKGSHSMVFTAKRQQ